MNGGPESAGVRRGSGLQQVHVEAQWCGQRRSGLSPAVGETEAGGTGAGRSKCQSSARTMVDCRCWMCWRPASPGGGRTLAPHSSSSWWTDDPCLCYCRARKDNKSS